MNGKCLDTVSVRVDPIKEDTDAGPVVGSTYFGASRSKNCRGGLIQPPVAWISTCLVVEARTSISQTDCKGLTT